MEININTTQTQTLSSSQADAFVKAHIGGVRHNLSEPVGGYPAPFPLEGTDNHLPTAIQMTDGIYSDTRSKLLSAGVTTIQGTEYQRILDEEVLKVLLVNIPHTDSNRISIAEMADITDISTWFYGNANIKEVDILHKMNITILKDNAFRNCTSLYKFIIPEGITELRSGCLWGSTSLKSVILPSTLTTIGAYCFAESGLETIIIPESLTTINNNAFYNCKNLTSIEFPSTLTAINPWVFQNSALRSITLPISVTNIGSGAFHNCQNLASINYEGTVEQCKAITWGDSYIFTNIPARYIQCSDGQVQISENMPVLD